MKRRFRWIWLFIGVLVIGATCGFGYEAKAARTEFEEARDAFAKKDWENVVSRLTPTYNNPPPEIFAAFLRTYYDPVISDGSHSFEHRTRKSTYIFIDNEDVFFGPRGPGWPPPITLRYSDSVAWFSIPFSKQRFGIFQSKKISMNFFMCLAKIAWDRYPQDSPREWFTAISMFVNAEKAKLMEIGITPKHLGSSKKTWEEFLKEFSQIYGSSAGSRGT